MLRNLLKSKIHRVTTTFTDLNYEGSCAIDRNLLEAANILEYEAIDIYNVTNGERFSTYAISAERGTGTISINGSAARKAVVGDILIIVSYALYCSEAVQTHKPTLVYVDAHNKIKSVTHAIKEQSA